MIVDAYNHNVVILVQTVVWTHLEHDLELMQRVSWSPDINNKFSI